MSSGFVRRKGMNLDSAPSFSTNHVSPFTEQNFQRFLRSTNSNPKTDQFYESYNLQNFQFAEIVKKERSEFDALVNLLTCVNILTKTTK